MKNSVIILQLELPSEIRGVQVFNMIKLLPFSGADKFGFLDTSFEDNILDGVFISQRSVYVNRYSIDASDVIREQVDYFSKSGFRINFTDSVLEYYGNKSDFNLFKRSLLNVLKIDKLDSIKINLNEKIYRIIEKFNNVKLEAINFPFFKFSKNLIGKYSVKVFDHNEGLVLMNKYDNDITSMKFSTSDYENVIIELTSDFRISAYCNRSVFLSIIKKLQ